MRLSLLAKFNEDWNLLVSQSFQRMDAQGVFYQEPVGSNGQTLAPLSVTVFNPSDDTDKYENTAWTLNGRLGALKLVYTGSYLDRKLDQTSDYTELCPRGLYIDYYQSCRPRRAPPAQAFCLLAERHLGGKAAQYPREPRNPCQHAGRLAPARHCRRVLRGLKRLRPDQLELPLAAGLHQRRPAWTA